MSGKGPRSGDAPSGVSGEGQGGEAARLLFAEGHQLLRRGEYARACEVFGRSLEAEEPPPLAYYYAGFSHAKLGREEEAILRYEQYLALRPRDVWANLELGHLHERAGNFRQAQVRYERVLSLHPGHEAAERRLENLRALGPTGEILQGSDARGAPEVLGENLIDVVQTQHFSVTYNVARHGAILVEALKVLELALEEMRGKLGFAPRGRVPVTFHHEKFRPLGTGRPAQGFFDGVSLHAVVDREAVREITHLASLLTHEYAHFCVYALVGGRAIPWWLHEGIAQCAARRPGPDRLEFLAGIHRRGASLPLAALEGGVGNLDEGLEVEVAYGEAHVAVEYLVIRAGWEGLRALLLRLSRGARMEEGWAELGTDYARFQDDLWRWVLAESKS